jgi:cation:H+ antiporter
MVAILASFALLSLVIVAAGIAMTRYADRIATATSMGHSLAGLLLLAAATSLPELSVGWAAVRIEAPDLAFGELLGSCLWNLMLLAILDLATRTRGRMFSRDSAAQALTAMISVVLAAITILGLTLDFDGVLLRASPFGWAILISYAVAIRLVYHDHGSQPETALSPKGETGPTPERSAAGLKPAIAGYLIFAAVLLLAAPRMATVAERLAEATGLGDTFLGVALIGLVTSLPEAVTTAAAIRLGHVNMAVANIFGSNAFNLTILGAIDFATPDSLFAIASPTHLIAATAIILITAVALMGILYRAEKRLWIVEPDAALVLLLLFAAIWLIYHTGP